MALSDYERSLLIDTSMQLMQQSLLSDFLFQAGPVGQSLRDMMLAPRNVVPRTNPFDEAITGTLRADVRTTLQNSANVSEAAAMVGIANESVATIKSNLEEMKAIIESISTTPTAAQTSTYDSLRSEILSLIPQTEYNGISLLDGTKWGTDQIDSNGNVYIQAYKNGGFDVNFQDFNALNFTQLTSANLGNSTDRATELARVTDKLGSTTIINDIYTNRQSGLEYQAENLKGQSVMLEQAVEARRQQPTTSTEDILLNLLLRDTGSLLDTSS